MDTSQNFVKSSYSNHECVEVAREATVAVRDSKTMTEMPSVSSDAWGAFLEHVKQG